MTSGLARFYSIDMFTDLNSVCIGKYQRSALQLSDVKQIIYNIHGIIIIDYMLKHR